MVTSATYNSKKNPFIVKAFEASTAHITQQDGFLLKKDDKSDPVAYSYEYGYFIFVDWEKIEHDHQIRRLKEIGYSQALINLINQARIHKCKFLQLDGDGIEYEDLPTFDW